MKKLLPIVALGALAGCTPTQVEGWLDWWHDDPEAAVDFAEQDWVQRSLEWHCDSYCDVDDPALHGDTGSSNDSASAPSESDGDTQDDAENGQVGGTASGTCGQWYGTAMDAGFTDSEWPTVARLMYRESNCQPGAYNPSGASGLMQIMPGWADDCGGSPSDLFNPWFNLHCAVHVKNVQGWGAWSTY